jgi:hypothetical protein
LAGLLLGAALAISSLSPDRIHPDLGQRLFGVLMGVIVILYSNEAPKAIPRGRCGSGNHLSLRRFAGWTLVLGGLGYALASAFAPIDAAHWVAGACLGTAVLLVLARFLWAVSRGPET